MFIKKYVTKRGDFFVLVLVQKGANGEKSYFNCVIPDKLAQHLIDCGVYVDEK